MGGAELLGPVELARVDVDGDDGPRAGERRTQDRGVTDAAEFMQQAPEMNLNELNAGSIRLTYELAATQLDMEAKMGVVNSSKSSIETLMKNQ